MTDPGHPDLIDWLWLHPGHPFQEKVRTRTRYLTDPNRSELERDRRRDPNRSGLERDLHRRRESNRSELDSDDFPLVRIELEILQIPTGQTTGKLADGFQPVRRQNFQNEIQRVRTERDGIDLDRSAPNRDRDLPIFWWTHWDLLRHLPQPRQWRLSTAAGIAAVHLVGLLAVGPVRAGLHYLRMVMA